MPCYRVPSGTVLYVEQVPTTKVCGTTVFIDIHSGSAQFRIAMPWDIYTRAADQADEIVARHQPAE